MLNHFQFVKFTQDLHACGINSSLLAAFHCRQYPMDTNLSLILHLSQAITINIKYDKCANNIIYILLIGDYLKNMHFL